MVMAETKNKNQAYLDMDDKFVNPVLARSARIVAERASGSYIYDMNGDAYLDLSTGIAVNSVGHCHPKVVAAAKAQLDELMHTSVTVHHKRYIELCKKLVEIAPSKKLDSVFLTNSGAEAVEGAMKMARYVTGRPAIINFRGSFHGRTMFTTALTTSKLYYREKYEPLPGSIHTSIFPYEYRSHFRGQPDKVVDEVFENIEMLFHQFVHPDQVACFLVEPIQGEGGYIVPPNGFLPRLRKLADQHGILLVIDEVQSGFARTGKMFAIEHEGVEPDIMLMAKALAGGLPLAAFISKSELTKKWPAGRHGSTFGGNPVSCAAALATIEVMQEEKLCERAEKVGEMIMGRLKKFAAGKDYIGEVRGRGLMIGIEFNDKNGGPSKELADKVAERCLEQKMIVLTCGNAGQVIRLIPPLNISDADAQKACDILEKAMTF
ncbi:MAG TPA: aminotransferase class III-fold pyridoxal phosphate-dependent enzyme [Candidatus Obscuribacter sp.]|nr:aminotransferase class III-fold pyridoxal phosphate-dependent enzyme [Candidatus Obscuribacter sp.]MBK9279280.1 aminotransferase class III-fold pyridoxal phosphate-dependent enzyme [Candidatus Obscuribacter sp.]MBL8084495.1 aminotransferase class III-fold pyridoxal phosphate-dependent enzyme [Candidatus Obscuribacter sp.]HMW92563.1 aminotransferase class III-fold pyridoxal phosphate-dependent enzyme [Candidatus Obscuribacter sp.]HMX44463.1 aminotransferase class III-fold pyridoxal phosphate-